MKWLYLIIVGLISAIVATDMLLSIVKLDIRISVLMGLLVGLLAIVYCFIKGSFDKTLFKEFVYSILIGFAVLIVATGILVMLGIQGQTSPYFIALLAGIYSFKKISSNKPSIEDEENGNNMLKIRKCPCCQEEISKKHFLKQILIGRGSISFTEKEKGLVCQKCNRQILSAEKKFLITLTLMLVSMMPMIIFGSTYGFSSSKERIIKLVLVLVVSFMIWVILILKKFDTIEFVCDDESSDEFEHYSIRE